MRGDYASSNGTSGCYRIALKSNIQTARMDYQMRDAQPPSRETMDEAISRFRAVGLEAV
jgi:hypothetical protein